MCETDLRDPSPDTTLLTGRNAQLHCWGAGGRFRKNEAKVYDAT